MDSCHECAYLTIKEFYTENAIFTTTQAELSWFTDWDSGAAAHFTTGIGGTRDLGLRAPIRTEKTIRLSNDGVDNVHVEHEGWKNDDFLWLRFNLHDRIWNTDTRFIRHKILHLPMYSMSRGVLLPTRRT